MVPLGEYTVADTIWFELGSAAVRAGMDPSAASAHPSSNANRRPGMVKGRRPAGRTHLSERVLRSVTELVYGDRSQP